mgnify:CR=1 FL=1
MKQMAQNPGTPLYRTAFNTITAHSMNSGHSQKSSTGGACREADLAVVITNHALQTVVSGHETIDNDVVAFEQVLQLSLILRSQQVEDRLINLFPCYHSSAFIEFPRSSDIKLEEIQTLHVQPLMSETGNEVVRSGVVNETIHLSA